MCSIRSAIYYITTSCSIRSVIYYSNIVLDLNRYSETFIVTDEPKHTGMHAVSVKLLNYFLDRVISQDKLQLTKINNLVQEIFSFTSPPLAEISIFRHVSNNRRRNINKMKQ